MKCKFCGAEIKAGSNICAYCDSEVERPMKQTTVKASRKPPKDIASVIGRTVIAVSCISALAIVATTAVTLNSDAFRFVHEYSAAVSSAQDIPRNQSGMTGLVIGCGRDGSAQLEYEGSLYENVRILDEELIEWLNDTDRRLDSVTIRFATDEDGNISELGLLSADFFVISGSDGRYTAVRDGHAIRFTAQTPLEIGCCYSGYFSYPDMSLYWGQEQRPMSISYMDPKCDDKRTETQSDFYTGEALTVYQISAVGRWYYCSQDIYDSIQVGDPLNDYELYSDQELDFISK